MKSMIARAPLSYFTVISFILFVCGCSKKPTPIVITTVPLKTVSVSTIAGGSKGYYDGVGASARFDSPNSVAVDAMGNLYVVDYNNKAVRKIDGSGVVTTLYRGINNLYQATIDQSGNLYVLEGPGILYKFGHDGTSSFYGPFQTSLPVAIASDGAGNVYEATFALNDYYIKKISTGGSNTVYAGTGSPGHTDGPLLSATVAPNYLAIDQSGNLYILEANDQGDLIRKITPANVVTMSINASHVLFQSPSNIYQGGEMAIDSKGNLYIADFLGNVIKKVTPDGVVSVLAGSGINGHIDGNGSTAQFSNPTGITIDAAGNLYVTEAGTNNDVRKILIE
ncbi:MAG: hypothetical protein JST19_16870 [Bacteroidetes bacterium]|nr:hypothetical protein [Bacteroidota bacterium]